MKIDETSSLREVAFCVCTQLDRVGVTAVLSGGGAATVHAPEAIQSFDIDMILTAYSEAGDPAGALADLGYVSSGQDYTHAASPFQLEFPPGPLAVGGELIETWDTLREGDGLLHVIDPTDSCRDRLAAFYFFDDRSALEQALAVARAGRERIDVGRIVSWSEREGQRERCDEFLRALDSNS